MAGLDYSVVDDLFEQRFAEGLTPGLVYGVVDDGQLVHVGSHGATTADGAGPAPTEHSVFRIASMSKSFTAAAVLLLRDRRALRLDDPVGAYVPEVDDPAITIRSLLTMSAGLLTDDPWGDRQESLGDDEFGEFLRRGFTTGRAPDLGFEYSNMGYALLGRTITALTGSNLEFVEHELLGPLGMRATRYAADRVGPALVPGHVNRLDGWEQLDPVGPGAFSAMGGLHSSVADLVTWVHGFVTAFDDTPDEHPLSKPSRRDMQQLHRFATVDATNTDEHGLAATTTGYGYGVMVQHDSQLGHFAMHSGGYPGYGSRMVWHPASRLGVITLSNGTYAGAYQQADAALRRLVRRRGEATPIVRRPAVADAVTAAVAALTERLAGFDPAHPWIDADTMAENVALDVPDAERRARIAAAVELVGAPLSDPTPIPYHRAIGQATWLVPAARGHYELEILLTPESPPRLQTATVVGIARAQPADRAALDAALATDARLGGPVTVIGEPIGAREFLVQAGSTWWRAVVADSGVRVEPHPAAAYPRLAWLADELTRLADNRPADA